MAVTPANQLVGQELANVNAHLRPAAMPQTLKDIELGQGGTIAGQVIDFVGQPMPNQQIVIRQANHEPIIGRSDRTGNFRVSGVSAGVCQVTCGQQAIACRCWAQRTAPPVATQQLLLVIGNVTERGQRPIADLLTGPVLIGLIIAAAVAIPIAIHNAQDDAS